MKTKKEYLQEKKKKERKYEAKRKLKNWLVSKILKFDMIGFEEVSVGILFC